MKRFFILGEKPNTLFEDKTYAYNGVMYSTYIWPILRSIFNQFKKEEIILWTDGMQGISQYANYCARNHSIKNCICSQGEIQSKYWYSNGMFSKSYLQNLIKDSFDTHDFFLKDSSYSSDEREAMQANYIYDNTDFGFFIINSATEDRYHHVNNLIMLQDKNKDAVVIDVYQLVKDRLISIMSAEEYLSMNRKKL